MTLLTELAGQRLDLLVTLFIFSIGLFVLFIFLLSIREVSHPQDTIQDNDSIMSHFRYFFNTLGEFFRRIFFRHSSG